MDKNPKAVFGRVTTKFVEFQPLYESEFPPGVSDGGRFVHFTVRSKDGESVVDIVPLIDMKEWRRFVEQLQELPSSTSGYAWLQPVDEKLKIEIRTTVSLRFEAEFTLNTHEDPVSPEARALTPQQRETFIIRVSLHLADEELQTATTGAEAILTAYGDPKNCARS